MFQYAVGRCLAYTLGTELKLDISSFDNDELRDYQLGCFNIIESFASNSEISKLRDRSDIRIIRICKRIIRKLLFKKSPYVREVANFQFDPTILNLSDDKYLDGYWQSRKYFRDIDYLLRQEFKILTPFSKKVTEFAEQIKSCESVSIHIRRTDYLPNSYKNQAFTALSMDYYNKSINYIIIKIPAAKLFIFSDDPVWCNKSFKLKYPFTIVDNAEENADCKELSLMALCKHNIIANSSFGWWAAWMNTNEEKIVIAPRKWTNKEIFVDQDFIPRGWIRF